MSNYSYVAVDPRGTESRSTLDVSDQSEALRRIKEMGLFLPLVSFTTQADPFGQSGAADNSTWRYSRILESIMIVTGPSFVRLTSMCAPNSPVWIGLPKSCASLPANCSYNGTAISGGAERL